MASTPKIGKPKSAAGPPPEVAIVCVRDATSLWVADKEGTLASFWIDGLTPVATYKQALDDPATYNAPFARGAVTLARHLASARQHNRQLKVSVQQVAARDHDGAAADTTTLGSQVRYRGTVEIDGVAINDDLLRSGVAYASDAHEAPATPPLTAVGETYEAVLGPLDINFVRRLHGILRRASERGDAIRCLVVGMRSVTEFVVALTDVSGAAPHTILFHISLLGALSLLPYGPFLRAGVTGDLLTLAKTHIFVPALKHLALPTSDAALANVAFTFGRGGRLRAEAMLTIHGKSWLDHLVGRGMVGLTNSKRFIDYAKLVQEIARFRDAQPPASATPPTAVASPELADDASGDPGASSRRNSGSSDDGLAFLQVAEHDVVESVTLSGDDRDDGDVPQRAAHRMLQASACTRRSLAPLALPAIGGALDELPAAPSAAEVHVLDLLRHAVRTGRGIWRALPANEATQPLLPPQARGRRLVYIDNSNLWIEGKMLDGLHRFAAGDAIAARYAPECSALGSAEAYWREDSAYRVDYLKLLHLLNVPAEPERRAMYLIGSRPPANEELWNRLRQEQVGLELRIIDRNASNREDRVDQELISLLIAEDFEPHDEIVIVAGDGGYAKSLASIMSKRRTVAAVHIVSWLHAASMELKTLRAPPESKATTKPRVQFYHLDPCIRYIAYDDHRVRQLCVTHFEAYAQGRAFEVAVADVPALERRAAAAQLLVHRDFVVVPADQRTHIVAVNPEVCATLRAHYDRVRGARGRGNAGNGFAALARNEDA